MAESHRLRLSTHALQICDTLPPVTDGVAAVAAMAALVALMREQAEAGDGFNVHLMALRVAAYSLRLAEWAER